MRHKCMKCKKEFDIDPQDPVRCQYCGYRIIVKARPEFRKHVKAR